MKVLHLAPLWFPVAHDSAGGRETLLASLVEAQQALGIDVTVLASGDSRVSAEVIPVLPRHLFAAMEAQEAAEATYYEQQQLLLTLERAGDFDVIHSHAGWYAYSLSGVPKLGGRVLHTHHTPVWRDLEWFIRQHPDLLFTAVSEFIGRHFWQQGARHCSVIPNGIDVKTFPWSLRPQKQLVFVGRMERTKGPDLAIAAAAHAGLPLTLAGPIVDREYFKQSIEPLLNEQIRYVGQVDRQRRNQLLCESMGAVLPFRGQEGLPMVTLEAMACGTPVLALANGPLPEIVEPGVTGYLAQTEAELIQLVGKLATIDRQLVRERVAARFDITVVAQQYLTLYRQILSSPPLP